MNGTTIGTFGPALKESFDLTLVFEQSILSSLPSAIFLAASPLRIGWLWKQEILVQGGQLVWAKIV